VSGTFSDDHWATWGAGAFFAGVPFRRPRDISIIVDVDRSLKEVLEGAADALSPVLKGYGFDFAG
jgi:hypothetical protein